MEQCAKLKQYAQFVDRLRTYQARDMTLAETVSIAVDECVKEGILAEFLSAHRAEVIDILLTEYEKAIDNPNYRQELFRYYQLL